MITQSRLKEIISYNPETGLIIRLKGRKPASDVVDSNGYLKMMLEGVRYYQHKLAWIYVNGEIKLSDIDHINGNESDNRLLNLREVTRSDNLRNRKVGKNNKSGVIGVHWQLNMNKWRATIHVDGRRKCLGFFSNIDEAKNARKEADILYGYHSNHGRAV